MGRPQHLRSHYDQYQEKYGDEKAVDAKNNSQHQLRKVFDPFFAALHEGLKQLDKTVRQHEKQQTERAQKDGKRAAPDRKTKALKNSLEELHTEVKSAELFHQHIHWLQQHFPKAEYEDVIGLCKLETPAEVKDEDYSLNPSRHVGIVIEEDGKTEEEFVEEILKTNDALTQLNIAAKSLETTISRNIAVLTGDA